MRPSHAAGLARDEISPSNRNHDDELGWAGTGPRILGFPAGRILTIDYGSRPSDSRLRHPGRAACDLGKRGGQKAFASLGCSPGPGPDRFRWRQESAVPGSDSFSRTSCLER